MTNENPHVALIELDGKAIGLAVMDGQVTTIRDRLIDFPDGAIVRILPKDKAVKAFCADTA